jgi:hypothetical protein
MMTAKDFLGFLASALLLNLHSAACTAGSISTVGDLKHRMRIVRPTNPACIRLLNATGTVGCGATKVVAPIAALEEPKKGVPTGQALTIVLNEGQAVSLF